MRKIKIDTMKETRKDKSSIHFGTTVTLLIMLSILLIFHHLILVKVIPFDIVWGGKLNDVSQMVLFVTVSVIISLMMIAVIVVDAWIVKFKSTLR
ncbi:MAG: hypothetical protein ACSLE0_13950 [Chitinophagaceae bacterium]